MESVSRLKSRPMVALLAVFSLVLFTACGGDENDDPSPTGNTGAISSGSQNSGDLAENQGAEEQAEQLAGDAPRQEADRHGQSSFTSPVNM